MLSELGDDRNGKQSREVRVQQQRSAPAPQLVASPVAAPQMMRQPYVLSLSPPGGPIDGNTAVEVRGRGLAAVRFVKFGDERGEVLHRGASLLVRSPPQ